MNDQVKLESLEGATVIVADKPVVELTRDQKIEAYRKEHRAEYLTARHAYECTCTPTREQMLTMEQYQNPPV